MNLHAFFRKFDTYDFSYSINSFIKKHYTEYAIKKFMKDDKDMISDIINSIDWGRSFSGSVACLYEEYIEKRLRSLIRPAEENFIQYIEEHKSDELSYFICKFFSNDKCFSQQECLYAIRRNTWNHGHIPNLKKLKTCDYLIISGNERRYISKDQMRDMYKPRQIFTHIDKHNKFPEKLSKFKELGKRYETFVIERELIYLMFLDSIKAIKKEKNE